MIIAITFSLQLNLIQSCSHHSLLASYLDEATSFARRTPARAGHQLSRDPDRAETHESRIREFGRLASIGIFSGATLVAYFSFQRVTFLLE